MALYLVRYVEKTLKLRRLLISICTITPRITLFVAKSAVNLFLLKVDLLNIRLPTTNELLFMCKRDQCEKGFKNRGDLNRHMKSRSDVWFNCRSCTYHNKDKRNRDSHERTHQEKGKGLEPYSCEHCGKAMRFSTQRR